MEREIRNHPNYIITDEGEVFRKRNNSYCKLKPDYSNGYARVDLDGVKEYVGRLVLETFEPPMNLSQRVFHIDGNTVNDRLDNLVWLSPSEIKLYSAYTIEYRLQELFYGARD